MLLNSFIFWICFIAIFAIYWLIPTRVSTTRKWFLIIVSYLLYMNWKPVFALVLLGVTLAAYYGAIIVDGYQGRKRKIAAWITGCMVLSPLILFKYATFFNDIVTSVLAKMHLAVTIPGLNWAIPIGISFFTFQALGYFLDVYRKVEIPEQHLDDFLGHGQMSVSESNRYR